MFSKNLSTITFCFFFVGVVVYLSFLLNEKESVSNSQTSKDLVINTQDVEKSGWLDMMAKDQNLTYNFPTNEMVLKYDFDRGVEPLRVFVQDLNEYHFYCINQILIDNDIEYAYYKKNSIIQLVIFLKSKEMQKKILEDFEYYDIRYSLRSLK